MIGLDTNVLVRYLVKDDPQQTARAVNFIREAKQADRRLFLNRIVLCETVWVLTSGYGCSRRSLVDVLERVLRTRQFEIEGKDQVWTALRAFKAGAADFSDFLIGSVNQASGCGETVTFDRKLRTCRGFQRL